MMNDGEKEKMIILKSDFSKVKMIDDIIFYNESVKCDSCSGKSVISVEKKINTGLAVLDENNSINFKNAYFKITTFSALAYMRDIINEDVYFVGESSPHKPHLFNIGNIRIGLIPRLLENIDIKKLTDTGLIIKM